MVVLGKKKENSGGFLKNLQKFSGSLISLGTDIENKLKEKEAIEAEIFENEGKSRNLRTKIFKLKERLIRLDVELSRLEKRRSEASSDKRL